MLNPDEQLLALVCPSCGAPLAVAGAPGALITCRHCGLSFRPPLPPKSRRGGVTLQAGGDIKIAGSIICGDVICAENSD